MNIHTLKLFTSNLEAMSAFYSKTLEIPPVRVSDKEVSFRIGASQLHFLETKETVRPDHFAFNIPSNQVEEAYKWLKERVRLEPLDGKEVVDFSDWNAHSLYFYDPDHNIVELISRHNLRQAGEGAFGAHSLTEISEIGLPVESIDRSFGELNGRCGLEIYDGCFKQFCAVGDEHGLFILMDRNKKGWLPNHDEAFPANFELHFSVGGSSFQMEVHNSDRFVFKD